MIEYLNRFYSILYIVLFFSIKNNTIFTKDYNKDYNTIINECFILFLMKFAKQD